MLSHRLLLPLTFMFCLPVVAFSANDEKAWERELKQPHYTVVDKHKCFSGNPHNYESLAYYAWPNLSDPKAPYIWKDGEPSPEYNNYDGIKLSWLKDHIHILTEAYIATNDRRYLDCCIEQINIWFISSETYMNPNLDYGQFIPGDRNGLGHTGAISEAYNFVSILDDVDLLNKRRALPTAVYKPLKRWFKLMLSWLQTSSLGNEMRNVKDNHAIMYDVLNYRIAYFIGNRKLCKQIRDEFPERRLAQQIADDGSQPRELLRTKAMMYSLYNLQHIIYFCKMQERDGVHFYDDNRRRIDAALRYVRKYIFAPHTFPYKEIGDWKTYKKQYSELEDSLSAI